MKLDNMDQDNLRSFLITLYGPQVNSWSMTAGIFNLTFKLLEESKKCSDLMDFVPRPLAPGQPPMKWLSKQVRGIFLRKLRHRKHYYAACISTAALKMKTKFLMEANGL